MKTIKFIFSTLAISFLIFSCSPETDITEFENNDEEQSLVDGTGTTTDDQRGF